MAGRPRNASASNAILAATVGILRERGYAGLTLDEVARVAGVGKSSLYSRFGSRPGLAAAAVASLQRELPPPSGELQRDLVNTLRAAERNLGAVGPGVIGSLLGEGSEENQPWRDRLLEPIAKHMRRVLELACGHGAVSQSADLDVALELLVGILLSRVLLGGPGSPAGSEGAIDAMLEWLSPNRRDQGSGNG